MAIEFNKLHGGAKKSEVKYMKLADGDNTFRILPQSILPNFTYWVTGANKKDLPFEALQFDRDLETFDNSRPCPVRDMGIKNDKGEDLRCQWAYKCQVINKATGNIEVLQLKKGIMNDTISVAQDLGIDPTCTETGTWLTVNRKKTGPLAYNVEYTVRQLKCKSSPLGDDDLALIAESKTMEELFPLETYAEQSARIEKHLSGAKEAAPAPSDDAEAIDELED